MVIVKNIFRSEAFVIRIQGVSRLPQREHIYDDRSRLGGCCNGLKLEKEVLTWLREHFRVP